MHSLILGQTESGKSALAKMIAKGLKNSGHRLCVYDPLFDPSFPFDYRSDEPDEFSEHMKSERNCHVFIDECGDFFEGVDCGWIATRGRHHGFSVYFLAQRMVQIPRTVRDQCKRLYLFASSLADGKQHADEWNRPELSRCFLLPKLTFFLVERFGETKLLRIKDDFSGIEKCPDSVSKMVLGS